MFSVLTLFLIFYNPEHQADLLRKSISIDISFVSKFLLNFHVSAPHVTVLLTIELHISNLFFLVICLFHSTLFSIAVTSLPLLILFLIFLSFLFIYFYPQIPQFFASSNAYVLIVTDFCSTTHVQSYFLNLFTKPIFHIHLITFC